MSNTVINSLCLLELLIQEDDEGDDELKSTLVTHLFSYKTNREVNKEDFFRFYYTLPFLIAATYIAMKYLSYILIVNLF